MIRSSKFWGLLLLSGLTLGLALWGIHLTVGFAFFHPEHIQSFGWPAVWLYVMLIILLGGVGVPPAALILPAAAVWPLAVSLPLSLVGGLGAAWLGFAISRHFLSRTVSARIPENIAAYEHRLETHAFSTVLVLRLLFYLFPPINWMLGISAVPLRHFLVATLLGMIPWTLAYVLTGKGILVVVEGLSPLQLLGLASMVLAGLLIWWRWAVYDPEADKP